MDIVDQQQRDKQDEKVFDYKKGSVVSFKVHC